MHLIVITILSLLFHDIHVSKTEVDYNETNQSIQISTHIYIDDLEEDIKNNLGGTDLFIGTEKESDSADYYIYNYLNEHLIFDVNDEPVTYDFVGKELSEDLLAVWIYVEIPDIEAISAITMQYDVLMDLYDDQKNIMSVYTPSDGKSFYLFHNKKKVDSVEY